MALALGSNGSSALFADCPLDSVYIGGKITYSTTSSYGYSPFYRNTSLRTVVITDREEQIYANEFYGCTNLYYVLIGNGAQSIGDYAFDNVFIFRSDNPASIVIPNSVKSIGNAAFRYCTKLVSVALPEGLTSIGQFAFYGCYDLASITLPNSMKDIGDYAFYSCQSLKSVVIPDGVTSVGNCSFYSCLDLESLTIGSGVQTFGWNAFENTYALKTVICKIVEVPNVQFYFSGTVFADATLYVPAESIEAYKADYTWGKFGTILPLDQAPSGVENVTSLGNGKHSLVKTIRNGQLLILRDGKTYNAQGAVII